MGKPLFLGRIEELKQLNQLYSSKKSIIAVVYGRRRIGKSTLVHEFLKNKNSLSFEGVEGEKTPEQIKQFQYDFARQCSSFLGKAIATSKVPNWNILFDYLDEYLKGQKRKTVIFFDEYQWIAAGQSKLTSLIKKYWDNQWKKHNVLLILCGSISSYMVKKVIKSKALYGRISYELCLGALTPQNIYELLRKKRSRFEVFDYYLVFGGIPKYIEEIDINKSFEINMNMLLFQKGSAFLTENKKIFYSQFREPKTYEKILRFLNQGPSNLQRIAQHLKIKSGGSLKFYLDNLADASFITAYHPYQLTSETNTIQYKLTDEFLRFHYKFVVSNLDIINHSSNKDIFSSHVKASWKVWTGFAFENFCLKNAMVIAEKLGFVNKVQSFGPCFYKGDHGFQIDLLYLRSDRIITLCEIKYSENKITTKVIPEVEKKCRLLRAPKYFTIEKALISKAGPDQALVDTEYFHHFLKVEDFFGN